MDDAGRLEGRGSRQLDPRAADLAVGEIADRSEGVVSRRELLDAGLTADQVRRRRERGLLRPSPHRGVFLVGHVNPAPRALLRAALKAVPGSALAGLSSAARHGVSQYSGTIELVTARRTGVKRPGLRVHRCPSLREEEVTEVDGLRCTTPLRMCLEVAAWHPSSLFRVLNERERLLLSTGGLREAARGKERPVVEAALARLQPGGQELRSPKEADLLQVLSTVADLPAPRTNAWIGEISVDFHWPPVGLVVLVDGGQDHLRASVFDRDRRVDNALADAGLSVRRYPSWRIDRDLEAVVAEIARAHRALRGCSTPMGELTVTTTLQKRGPAAAVVLTEEQAQQLGEGAGRFPVAATINGQTWRGQVASIGGEKLLGLSKAVRQLVGAEAGDEVEVHVVLDAAPREVELPPALQAALQQDPQAQAAFDALAPSRRKEHARSVAEAKQDATRERRVARVLEALRAG